MSIEDVIKNLKKLAGMREERRHLYVDLYATDIIDTAEAAIALLRTHPEARTDPEEVSDGYHTFNELYRHRAVLFSVICNEHPDLAWKSKHHHVGGDPMYDGMFIVGIDTPDGQATYHYDIDQYWDMFKVKELENAPEWDGHTPAQAIERIGLLSKNEPLTLEELRKMVGQPVWVKVIDHTVFADKEDDFDGWGMCRSSWVRVRDGNRADIVHVDYEFEIYGKEWLAYRRPPKEEK